MAAIEDLAKKISDVRLRDEILTEVGRLKANKKFGLVFEEHLPELMLLPQMTAKLGARVYKMGDSRGVPYRIVSIGSGTTIRVVPEAGGPGENLDRSEMIVTKAFGDAIYPALIPVDGIENAPEKPWHVLINSDNYHALQLLLYGYEGKIDVIYIDPPYNTGARDWKYNNDYVDKNDGYRHSKWLSMMKKRLLLAKRLLKPDGVFIITIDENECHRLGCLLQEIMPESRQETVTIVNNAAGLPEGGFYRVEEYAFFCFFGKARPCELTDDFLMDESKTQKNSVWFSLTRYGGINSLPSKRSGLVYPIGIDPKTLRIVGTGRTLKQRLDAGEIDPNVAQNLNAWIPDKSETVNGFPAVWPYRANGALSTWQFKPESLITASKAGFVRVRKQSEGPGGNAWSISYIKSGNQKKILNGTLAVVRREDNDGPYILGTGERRVIAKTVWKRARHDAGKWGSRTIRELLGDVKFDYAKSPYAVRDTLATIVADRPNAIVLDFFGGSGTTLHATAMLNAGDGGKRRCILVTNNEVDEVPASLLRRQGLMPGQPEFESHGICESVTWPRISACLTGKRADGTSIAGEYLDSRAIASGYEENAAYFKLDFLEPAEISRNEKLQSIIPILWMLAGCRGANNQSDGLTRKWYLPKGNPFGVLLLEDSFSEFRLKLEKRSDIDHVFLVTDSKTSFYEMSADLGKRVRSIQLYKSYIDTFRINLIEPGTFSQGGVPSQPAFHGASLATVAGRQ